MLATLLHLYADGTPLTQPKHPKSRGLQVSAVDHVAEAVAEGADAELMGRVMGETMPGSPTHLGGSSVGGSSVGGSSVGGSSAVATEVAKELEAVRGTPVCVSLAGSLAEKLSEATELEGLDELAACVLLCMRPQFRCEFEDGYFTVLGGGKPCFPSFCFIGWLPSICYVRPATRPPFGSCLGFRKQ